MDATPTQRPRRDAELMAVPSSDALAHRVRELEQANAELVEVAHLTAHDLKEPLCAIALLAETLAADHSEGLDDAGRRLVSLIRAGAERMQTTVEETLAAARGERAQLVRVDMQEAVAVALQNLEARPEWHDVKVRVDPLPVVVGDRTQLIRLMQNLLSNAIKFAGGAHHPRVSVSAEETRTGWTFTVRDNGIGMAPADADWLFEAFERDETDPRSGSGLGLTIARQVVENHGGSIWIQSARGYGAVVRFTLPHAQPGRVPGAAPANAPAGERSTIAS